MTEIYYNDNSPIAKFVREAIGKPCFISWSPQTRILLLSSTDFFEKLTIPKDVEVLDDILTFVRYELPELFI